MLLDFLFFILEKYPFKNLEPFPSCKVDCKLIPIEADPSSTFQGRIAPFFPFSFPSTSFETSMKELCSTKASFSHLALQIFPPQKICPSSPSKKSLITSIQISQSHELFTPSLSLVPSASLVSTL